MVLYACVKILPHEKFKHKNVLQWLGNVLRCPICGIKYRVETTKLLNRGTTVFNEASILIHSDCLNVNSVMFNVKIRGRVFIGIVPTTQADTPF